MTDQPDMAQALHMIMVGMAGFADGLREISQLIDSGYVSFDDAKWAIREFSKVLDDTVSNISA